MLSHFPTVTQSAGFQPEQLITAHSSLLSAHCSAGYWLPASGEGMALIRRQMLSHDVSVNKVVCYGVKREACKRMDLEFSRGIPSVSNNGVYGDEKVG